MKTPEELAKETLQKKFKFSPDLWTDCHTCFVYGYDAAKPEWISVKDRLPEKDQDVLWYNPTLLKPMDVDPISPLWNGCLEHNTYTHWMPLPTPPEE